MCISIISNRKKTIVGWNLDILDIEHKVVAEDDRSNPVQEDCRNIIIQAKENLFDHSIRCI